jgi:inner membrane protein
MDSVTQIALGGAVGYAVLGNKVGRKAVLWGAVLGTLPDLDVFIPYGDAIANFTYHRSFSHSILVHLLVSPLIVWLITKIHQGTAQFKKQWFYLVFLCLSTHAILDSFTVYGTQLLWPITEYPFGVSNLFIIDPLVTLPLLFGLGVVLWPKVDRLKASRMNTIGLSVSAVYIAWTLIAKVYIDHKVHIALEARNIESQAYMSTPAPLNSFLWRIVVSTDNEYYEGYASVFDSPEQVSLDPHPSDLSLLDNLQNLPSIQRLQWFTKGLYSVRLQNDAVIMTDLRMGVECAYVFNFKVAQISSEGIQASAIEQFSQRPDLRELGNIFKRIWDPNISLAPGTQRIAQCRNFDSAIAISKPQSEY